MDAILEEFITPEVLRKYMPVAPIGQDKLFNPCINDINVLLKSSFWLLLIWNCVLSVWLARQGREDMRGLLSSVPTAVFVKNLIKVIETHIWLGKNYPEHRRPNQGTIIKGTFIFDLVLKTNFLISVYWLTKI